MFFWLLITSIAILIGPKTFYYYIGFVIYLIISLYVAKVFGINGTFYLLILVINIVLTYIYYLAFYNYFKYKLFVTCFIFNLPFTIFFIYNFIKELFDPEYKHLIQINDFLLNIVVNLNFFNNVYITGLILLIIGNIPNIFLYSKLKQEKN